MKWLVVFVCLAQYAAGGALRCEPGSDDSICITSVEKESIQLSREARSTEWGCKGEFWQKNCSYCLCTQAGIPGCWTQEDCFRTYKIPEKVIPCSPKTVFKRGCNTCICMDNGHALCTMDNCEMSTVPKKSQLGPGKECAQGSHWKSQCNDCSCSSDGYPYCTEKACPGQESEPLMRCAPDTLWNNECNTCWCTSDGRAMCTRMGCNNEVPVDLTETKPDVKAIPELDLKIYKSIDEQNSPDANSEDKQQENSEEDMTKDGSDSAIANPDNNSPETYEPSIEKPEHSFEEVDHDMPQGHRDLDTIQIEDQNNLLEETPLQKKHDSHNVLKRSVCKPNQLFQLECNACKCAADGQSYSCTQNECMEGEKNKEVEVFMEDNEEGDHIERHSVCKPRGTFYIGCNTCHCNLYGTDYSCTNKPCPLDKDVEIFHELKPTQKSSKNETHKIVCVANRMFIKDCNTCWCNEDGTSFICTRKVCVPEEPDEGIEEEKSEELRILIKDCRPNEVFELDCNMCRCNPDGKSYSCTRRACVEVPEEDTKNTTTLSRKTRAVTQEAPKACQPGQEFRMDCNKCLCDNEGKDFSCTRIDCNALNGNGGDRSKRDTSASTSTSEEVAVDCVSDSVFDRDCNVCRCTGDGHHAMCTTKACLSRNAQNNDVNAPLPEADPNFRCNPGEQFKRGCNDCSCSADGKSVFCTVKFCDQDITPPPSL